jgi:hypothetical protein
MQSILVLSEAKARAFEMCFARRITEMSSGMWGALMAYLLTALSAIAMLRRSANGRIRFLTFVVGLLPLCQTMLMLREYGVFTLPAVGRAAELVELFVSALCLSAIHLLNKESFDRKLTDAKLRLVEAEVPNPRSLHEVPAPCWLSEEVITEPSLPRPIRALAKPEVPSVVEGEQYSCLTYV